MYREQGKYADAEGLYKRALAIQEKALGADHPDVADGLNGLAILSARSGNSVNALAYSRKATGAVIAHAFSETTGAQQKEGTGGLIEQHSDYFVGHVAHLAAAARKRIEPEAQLGREALVMAQWAKQSAAATAVQQMGLRFAGGTDALAALVRQRQDLSAFWRERDKALVEALSKPEGQRNAALIKSIRKQIVNTESMLAADAARLAAEFPEYAALASPKPLNAEDLQQLLGTEEALVFFLTGDKESYVFALTREAFEWKTIPLGAQTLSEKVTAFRHGLDVDTLRRGLERVECTRCDRVRGLPLRPGRILWRQPGRTRIATVRACPLPPACIPRAPIHAAGHPHRARGEMQRPSPTASPRRAGSSSIRTPRASARRRSSPCRPSGRRRAPHSAPSNCCTSSALSGFGLASAA